MPETRTYTVWSYEEAPDDLKEKILAKNRDINTEYTWWGYIYEDASTIGNLLGLEIGTARDGKRPDLWFRGFCSQGVGACWGGMIRFNALKDAVARLHTYVGAGTDESLERLARDCEATYRQALNALIGVKRSDAKQADVEQALRAADLRFFVSSNDRYFSSRLGDYDFRDLHEEYECVRKPVFARRGDYNSGTEQVDLALSGLEDSLQALADDFADWAYHRLEKECEYLESDEAVAETLIANDYRFDEAGNID